MRNHFVLIGSCIFSVWMLSLLTVRAQEYLTFDPPVSEAETFKFTPPVNYDKLCKAIAVAETSGCTDGTAIKRKNCHGIMAWKKVDGKTVRYPRYFKSHAESQAACVSLWKRAYVKFPDMTLAKKWTGGDNSKVWLNIVTQKYNSM